MICDAIANAPDVFWQCGAGNSLYMLDLPATLQRPQRPLVEGVLTPELNRLHLDNPSDVQVARTMCVLGWGYPIAVPDEIRKDQFMLRTTISSCLSSLGYTIYHDICGGCPYIPDFNEPKKINREIARARNYLDQLEPSTLKGKWNEQLLELERIAGYWEDFCRNNLLYADFRQYMDLYGFER
jgi:hypothetical protein